jgi:hypothetical protein
MQLVRIDEMSLKESLNGHRRIPNEGFQLALILIIVSVAVCAIMLAILRDVVAYPAAGVMTLTVEAIFRRNRWARWYRRNVRGYSLVIMGMPGASRPGYAITRASVVVMVPRYQLPGFRLALGGWRKSCELFFHNPEGVNWKIIDHSIENEQVTLQDGAHNIIRLPYEKVLCALIACEQGSCATFDDLIFPEKTTRSRSANVMLFEDDTKHLLN